MQLVVFEKFAHFVWLGDGPLRLFQSDSSESNFTASQQDIKPHDVFKSCRSIDRQQNKQTLEIISFTIIRVRNVVNQFLLQID